MERDKLDGIRIDIIAEVYDSNRGGKFARFKRALWYGSGGTLGGYFGDGKGVRKAIRNMPKTMLKKNVTGFIGSPLKMALAPVSAVPVAGPMIAGLITGLVITPIELALEEAIKLAKEVYTMEVEDGSSYKGDIKKMARKVFKKGPRTADEELRKQIKHDVKEMTGVNGLLVIDRNLVKMKDAKARIESAVKKLEIVVGPTKIPFDGFDDKHEEQKMEAANEVLVAIIETGYYIKKITGLVETMQAALNKVSGELKELDKGVNAVDEKIEKYILGNL